MVMRWAIFVQHGIVICQPNVFVDHCAIAR